MIKSETSIAIATCSQLPELDPDDRLLVDAVSGLGLNVRAAVWNDEAFNWSELSACIVRSTWDYHRSHELFLSWVREVSSTTLLLNPENVIRWNLHKSYLRHLEKCGIPIVPTHWLQRRASIDLPRLVDKLGWSDVVIKPAYGASADGIMRISNTAHCDSGQAYLDQMLQHQDALLQPFLPSVATRHERALVFIDSEYSHAVTKAPFMHAKSDLSKRAHVPPGSSGEIPVRATEEEIALADRALKTAPPGHIFGRVDIVLNDGIPCVLEVELIEPTLYLYAKPAAAFKLAHCIRDKISAKRAVSAL